MGIFDEPKKGLKAKPAPFYRVEATQDSQYDYEPGTTVELVAVGPVAHYVLKGPDSRVHGMHPYDSVLCVRLVDDEDEEE